MVVNEKKMKIDRSTLMPIGLVIVLMIAGISSALWVNDYIHKNEMRDVTFYQDVTFQLEKMNEKLDRFITTTEFRNWALRLELENKEIDLVVPELNSN